MTKRRGPGPRALLACGACLLAAVARAGRFIEDTDHFPGWKGEVSFAQQAEAQGSLVGQQTPEEVRSPAEVAKAAQAIVDRQRVKDGAGENSTRLRWNTPFLLHEREWKQERWDGHVEELSWSPRLYHLHGFLTAEECDHLIELARPSMEPSTVVNNTDGSKIPSRVRTSSGTFFARGSDEVIGRIEKRISLVSHIPVQNGEGMQVLRYVDGQNYEPHHDFFHDSVNPAPSNGGQRVATVLLYLSTVEEGGETVFPKAANGGIPPRGPEFSPCAQRGLAVKPRKGNGVLFYGLSPDGEKDWASLHGSCPTLAGEKWSATKWLRQRQYGGRVGIAAADTLLRLGQQASKDALLTKA